MVLRHKPVYAEFAPPRTGGQGRSLALALLAHALLLGGLTTGVSWQQEDMAGITVEAELWNGIPRLGQAQVAPTPQPDPLPLPPQPRAEPQPAPAAPPDTALRDAQIALERQQAAQAAADKARQEQARRERLAKQAEEDRRAKEEAARKERDAKERDARKRAEEQRLAEEKRAADRKAADERKQAERKTADDKAREDKARQANLARMSQMAGTEMGSPSGSPHGGSSAGSGGRTGDGRGGSAMSASYGARVAGKLRPNIVYTDEIVGNPETEVDVRATSDGTILSRKVVKPSGNKAWDEAVLNAIDKAGRLPPDVDGRYPTWGTIKFRPKD